MIVSARREEREQHNHESERTHERDTREDLSGVRLQPSERALVRDFSGRVKLLDREDNRTHRARIASSRPRDVDTWDDYEAVRMALVPG